MCTAHVLKHLHPEHGLNVLRWCCSLFWASCRKRRRFPNRERELSQSMSTQLLAAFGDNQTCSRWECLTRASLTTITYGSLSTLFEKQTFLCILVEFQIKASSESKSVYRRAEAKVDSGKKTCKGGGNHAEDTDGDSDTAALWSLTPKDFLLNW